ncbi:hypothetical protein [Shewanella halifaxensis]|uniref:hypothetical protein n=1 Tax=Shewanella halifaxensis TaxID=271098 RepID=UPI0002FA8F1D|nr:hypothetical protein [Shewanella halifaxensis]
MADLTTRVVLMLKPKSQSQQQNNQVNAKQHDPVVYETVSINGRFIAERRYSNDRRACHHNHWLNIYDRRQVKLRRMQHVDIFI